MAMINNVNELPELAAMLDGGFVGFKTHEVLPLRIYNYTPRTQYGNVWNETTITCRGLVTDVEGNVKSRPFRKFFNLEQVEQLPSGAFEVFEKIDGSLGVTYWDGDFPYIASRGAFHSPQADEANKMLAAHPGALMLDPEFTYLWEIVYPDNRIVVDYGQRRELVLLGAIHTATGREMTRDELAAYPFVQPEKYGDYDRVHDLKSLSWKNCEGFVVRFDCGYRVKVKLDEYCRLHKLLTGVSERTILRDYLIPGNDIQPLLDRVPDEFYQWVQTTLRNFRDRFDAIEAEVFGIFMATKRGSRKELAEAYQATPYPAILFAMLDQKPHAQIIWKMLKADTSVFKVAEDA